ncbi:MAG TPA: hypothetical protein VH743_18795 [Beijerinckiaceae bacterium]
MDAPSPTPGSCERAVCRWAQPAIETADALVRRHRIRPERIAARVESFDAAVRLDSRASATTEEAQYALGLPLAAMVVRGRVGVQEIMAEGLRDEDVLRITQCIVMEENAAFTRRFPAERIARVTIALDDGGSSPSRRRRAAIRTVPGRTTRSC